MEQLQVSRKWLVEMMMLKQDIQIEDENAPKRLNHMLTVSQTNIDTEQSFQELNETENTPHSMANEEYEDDGDKQESYCNLSTSAVN